MFSFDSTNKRNQALRVALTVTICMLIGQLFNFDSPVYFALYPTIVMTKGQDYSWVGLFRMFIPTLAAASAALAVSEIFSEHPFIIWTTSLLFFDWMRRRADTPAKLGQMLMPTFNWILIVVFAEHTNMDMPMRIHEIFLAMVITAVVAKGMVALFPVKRTSKPIMPTPVPVSMQSRLISLILIGTGVGFLMIVDIISATFCMVPVIAAATQTTRHGFASVVDRRFQTQVGGCAIAIVFTIIMAGHQSTIGYYALGLAGLALFISASMAKAHGAAIDIHADALLATMLPIQLYITNTNPGIENMFLRAWELTVTLGILYGLYHLIAKAWNSETTS